MVGDWSTADWHPSVDDGLVTGLEPVLSLSPEYDDFPADGSTVYTVTTDPDGHSNALLTSDGASREVSVPAGVLAPDTLYYWRVTASGTAGPLGVAKTVSSAVHSFRTAPVPDGGSTTEPAVPYVLLGDADLDAQEGVTLEQLTAAGGEVRVDQAVDAFADVVPFSTQEVTPYTRRDAWKDNKALTVAYRYGTATWGHLHVQKHNISLNMIKKATQFPRTRSVEGTTVVYITPAREFVCYLWGCYVTRSMDVKVVVANNRLTDGYNKGVITAYCVGPKVCPNWVRATAGG
jgi:hypothetical protein